MPAPDSGSDTEAVIPVSSGTGTPVSTNIPPTMPAPLPTLPVVQVPNPSLQLLADFLSKRGKLDKDLAALRALMASYDRLERASVDNHRDTLMDRPPAVRAAALRREAD